MTDETDVDEKLRRLKSATDAIGPRAGFSHRVMDAVLHEPVGLTSQILIWSRRAIPLALVAVAAAGVWAAHMDGAVDEVLAASYGTPEVEW